MHYKSNMCVCCVSKQNHHSLLPNTTRGLKENPFNKQILYMIKTKKLNFNIMNFNISKFQGLITNTIMLKETISVQNSIFAKNFS